MEEDRKLRTAPVSYQIFIIIIDKNLSTVGRLLSQRHSTFASAEMKVTTIGAHTHARSQLHPSYYL